MMLPDVVGLTGTWRFGLLIWWAIRFMRETMTPTGAAAKPTDPYPQFSAVSVVVGPPAFWQSSMVPSAGNGVGLAADADGVIVVIAPGGVGHCESLYWMPTVKMAVPPMLTATTGLADRGGGTPRSSFRPLVDDYLGFDVGVFTGVFVGQRAQTVVGPRARQRRLPDLEELLALLSGSLATATKFESALITQSLLA